MPATKKSKNSTKTAKARTQQEKRKNREAEMRAEKIHEFDAKLEYFYCLMDQKEQSCIDSIEGLLRMAKQRAPQALMQMNMAAFLELDLAKLSDWTPAMTSTASSAKPSVSADAGYFTEESVGSRDSDSSVLVPGNTRNSRKQKKGCVPVLPTLAAERNLRRSRSASSAGNRKHTTENRTDRSTRSKQRNSSRVRPKAVSLDRVERCVALSPNAAFMRFPKPGELVLSTLGSPIVAQVMAEKYANANIPVMDGMLFLKPKALTHLRQDLIENIDVETLNQIKILSDNLELIINEANKAGTK